jgi:ribulose 1,5-bisphosphate synthetase/thiazole synthase
VDKTEAAMDALMEPVRYFAAGAASFEKVMGDLFDACPEMDTNAFAGAMKDALVVSHLATCQRHGLNRMVPLLGCATSTSPRVPSEQATPSGFP